MLRYLSVFSCGVLLFSLSLVASIKADEADLYFVVPPNRVGLQASPGVLKLVFLGQLEVLSDYLYISALQDDSIYMVSPGERAYPFYFLEPLTRIDRAHFNAFFVGGYTLSLVRDDLDGAIEIFSRGFEFLKNEPNLEPIYYDDGWDRGWIIPFGIGFTYFFEKNEPEKGLPYLEQVKSFPNAPRYALFFARNADDPKKRFFLVRNHFSLLSKTEQNPVLKEVYRRKLAETDFAEYLFDLNQVWSREKSKNWTAFKQKYRLPEFDPFGGRIFLEGGRIVSETKLLGNRREETEKENDV